MREQRKRIAEQTLIELQQGFYLDGQGNKVVVADDVRLAVNGTAIYKAEALATLLSDRKNTEATILPSISVIRGSTIECLITLSKTTHSKIALLNFASAKNPGGGFLGGSQAQEESLARSSALYSTLLHVPEFYSVNRNGRPAFYTDNLIYSPGVIFFKDDGGLYLDTPVKADVITMPAVNRSAITEVGEQVNREIETIMKQRMRYVLTIAEQKKVNTLILGAWGCGVFKNSPADIARYFKDVLSEGPQFQIEKIIFAIYGEEKTLLDFQRCL